MFEEVRSLTITLRSSETCRQYAIVKGLWYINNNEHSSDVQSMYILLYELFLYKISEYMIRKLCVTVN